MRIIGFINLFNIIPHNRPGERTASDFFKSGFPKSRIKSYTGEYIGKILVLGVNGIRFNNFFTFLFSIIYRGFNQFQGQSFLRYSFFTKKQLIDQTGLSSTGCNILEVDNRRYFSLGAIAHHPMGLLFK